MLLDWLRSLRLENPEILGLGCGTGWFTERLAQLGRITGVDLNRKAMEEAQARVPQATFLGGDLFELPLPREHYDVLVAQQVIAHMANQPRFMERVAFLLKPLFLTTPNKFVMDRLEDVGYDPPVPEHIEQWLDRRSLVRLLKVRLEILRFTSILPMGQRGILRVVNSVKLNRMLRVLTSSRRIEALKERTGCGYTLIVLARKRS
jgi:2-polyprenyl-3-methyl-5-hydroxy-6-metoxy-1,4-benzoquinol methylase